MKVHEIMSKDVYTTGPEATLGVCIELLEKQRHNGLVVVEGGKVVGMVTKADIFRAILPTQAEICQEEQYMKDLEIIEERITKCLEIPVEKIMGSPVTTISGKLPIIKAGSIMILHKIKQVPVVENDRLVGLITLSDILSALKKKSGH